jgi:Hydrolase N-terminal helical domain
VTFTQADLVARAGIDPWKLRDKLLAGDPAQIETLASAFYRAGGDMGHSNQAQHQAQTYVGEGYTVNGKSPLDFDAQARATKQTPEHLNTIGRILTTIAGDLDGNTHRAKSEVTTLEGTIQTINGKWTSFMQSIGHHLPPDDQQSVRQEYLTEAVNAVKTSGGKVDTIIVDYEVGLIDHLKSLADLGYVLPAALDEGPDPIDLARTNADGEQNGGINPDLTLNQADLKRLLDEARRVGLDPKRYAALLQQYYLVKAADEAGIDLSKWDPAAGAEANKANIIKVYQLYGKFFLDHPELQWAGMANMIGPSFAGGFMDLASMKNFFHELADKIDHLPPGVKQTLPPGLVDLAEAGANLGAGELNYFETKFLAMQKHIFMDQASMHEAYLTGGTGAINEMAAAGLVDGNAQTAWNEISSGDPAKIQHGNMLLLDREQNKIINKQYDDMYNHDGIVGKVMTYGMTVAGSASIPGTKTPGEFSPLTASGSVRLPGPVPFVHETVGVDIKTPLPDFNVANKDDRWNYITNDTLPAFQKLLHDHPDQARAIIGSSVDDRLNAQRLAQRWPQLADDLLTNWDIDVHGSVGLNFP